MRYVANGRIYDTDHISKQYVSTVGENAYRYGDDIRIDEHARYEKRSFRSSILSSQQYIITTSNNTIATSTTTYYTYTATYSRTTRSNTYLYNTGTSTSRVTNTVSSGSYTVDIKLSERRSSTIPGMMTTSMTRTYWNAIGLSTYTLSAAPPETGIYTAHLTATYASVRNTYTETGPYGNISYTVSQSASKLIYQSRTTRITSTYRITKTTSSYRTTYYSQTYTSTYTPYYSSRSQTYSVNTTTVVNTTSSSSSSTTTSTKPGVYGT